MTSKSEDLTTQADTGEAKKYFHEFSADQSLSNILDALPEAVIILNRYRQVVYINKVSPEVFGLGDRVLACGLSPGELFNCNHARETCGGCGTTNHCKYCGANITIIASQLQKTDIKECRITQQNTGIAIDLRVKAAPFEFDGETFTVFSILDISNEKRREVLQQLFFHDILNTVGGLSGYTELLLESNEDEAGEIKSIIFNLSQTLSAEIISQQQLVAAENGTLNVLNEDLSSIDLLKSMIQLFQQMPVTKEKTITLDTNSEDIRFKSDSSLLSRVFGNLSKNALEASGVDQEVLVGCRRVNKNVEFFVINKSVMSDSEKYQVFQRSFSTKGLGRGLGTYSIKLFTEKYLKGKVRITSNDESGTTFFVSYPIT